MPVDSTIVQFALAVAKHWLEFVTGAVLIGGIVGLLVTAVERYRGAAVAWSIYVVIFVVGGLVTASYYAWLDQMAIVKKQAIALQQYKAALSTPPPAAYIGFPKTTFEKSKKGIFIDAKLHNYGSISAENIGTVGSVVFGNDADSQMLTATLSPPVRLLPGEEQGLRFGIIPKNGNSEGIDAFLRLVEKKEPVVLTINLYFLSNGRRYSQHTIMSYDYRSKKWNPEAEQVLEGFVAMPAATFKGSPQYWTAPWLPPIPPSITAGATCQQIPVVTRP